MGWHYIEFITRNSRMDGKRVQCFHRKGSTRIQHVEVSQTFTKWSNCCIHRGYVLSWLSLKMYIQVFSWPRSYFDLFYMLEILSASHCIRALWLRIMWKQLWYVFPIPFLSAGDWILCDLCLMSSGRSWQKDTKQPNKYVIYIYIYYIYVRYIFCWLSNSNSKRNSSNSLMHWLFFGWSCQGAQQLFHHVKSSLQKRCFACMCSFCFLCYDSPPKEELIHADKQRLVLQSKFLEVFFVAASNCVWPAIWHLFHHRPVDLERFPPPGASQTFIAHASVEAKSRWGRE